MMDQTVANQGLADNARFGIANTESVIRPVTISPRYQILGELKDVVFQMAFKNLNINSPCFAFPKFVPR